MENRPEIASPRSDRQKKPPAVRLGVLEVRIRAGDEDFLGYSRARYDPAFNLDDVKRLQKMIS